MKQTRELKKQVEKAESSEAARETIVHAGMPLKDEEIDQVTGGWPGETINTIFDGKPNHPCPNCGEGKIYESGRGWYCPKCENKS